ncbi:major facilitator superfamily protein, putative [Ichthyophthirius multifiliis]|uniref:Hexose transporter 1 n=1 Tax=Ichthyophthirius multifiliis TaxID=5932 RepID=G0QLB3_ICHMU|nr:major facilitator superfamily protein, putative [Ichthyophthirius multifiliis]EGR33992.1 major facilitator superfamily protein, putative [Ichthyophthirius multifiliis]|eukprot:XP_004039296.1 major facilitator superfamily protein, putative [Ichthyophthirius multifiliis]
MAQQVQSSQDNNTQVRPVSQSGNKASLPIHEDHLYDKPNMASNSHKNEKHHHHLKQEWRIYCMTLNACLGSFYFGYNLGVYNSAQRVIQELNEWTEDQYKQYTSIITAFMPLGALIGCLISKQIITYLNGIRKSMIVFDILGIIGTIILISDTTVPNLLIGRIICGFVVGINTAIVPVYIKDFSPIEISGKAGGINQVALTFGTFCSYLAALLVPLPEILKEINYTNQVYWRILLGIPIITCLIRLTILSFIYKLETPTFMMKQHRYEEVKGYLQQIYENDEWKEVFQELEEKVNTQQNEKKEVKSKQNLCGSSQNHNSNTNNNNNNNEINSAMKSVQGVLGSLQTNQDVQLQLASNQNDFKLKSEEEFFREKLYQLGNKYSYKRRFFIGCLIQFCTQLSGVNAILFYSNEIFKEVTQSEMTARICTIFLGLNNTLITTIGIKIIQKIGRRTFMLSGIFVVQLTMYILSILQVSEKSVAVQILGIVLIFIYLQGWQLSLGAVTWVYNAEILDVTGISISTFIRWALAMFIGFVFPFMKADIKLFGSFIVFGGVSSICFVILYFLMKETKDKNRYQILQNFCDTKTWKLYEKEAMSYAKEQIKIQNGQYTVA